MGEVLDFKFQTGEQSKLKEAEYFHSIEFFRIKSYICFKSVVITDNAELCNNVPITKLLQFKENYFLILVKNLYILCVYNTDLV